jgi:HK97 family phage prohead protease
MFAVIRKDAQLQLGAEQDTIEVVASDETVDRYGDIIRAEGWQLQDFKRNPVVLFAHDSTQPVGTAPRVWREGKQLRALIKLAAQGTSELIDLVRSLIAQKVLRAVSVGFRPTVEPNRIRDAEDRVTGFEFIGQELLELSIVAVGANPEALAIAKTMNLNFSDATIRRVFAAGVSASVATDVGQRERTRTLLYVKRLRVCSRQPANAEAKESCNATS